MKGLRNRVQKSEGSVGISERESSTNRSSLIGTSRRNAVHWSLLPIVATAVFMLGCTEPPPIVDEPWYFRDARTLVFFERGTEFKDTVLVDLMNGNISTVVWADGQFDSVKGYYDLTLNIEEYCLNQIPDSLVMRPESSFIEMNSLGMKAIKAERFDWSMWQPGTYRSTIYSAQFQTPLDKTFWKSNSEVFFTIDLRPAFFNFLQDADSQMLVVKARQRTRRNATGESLPDSLR